MSTNGPKTKVLNNSLQLRGLPNKITLQPGTIVEGVMRPGVSYVDSGDWEEAKTHESVQVLLEEKLITDADAEAAPVAPPSAPSTPPADDQKPPAA